MHRNDRVITVKSYEVVDYDDDYDEEDDDYDDRGEDYGDWDDDDSRPTRRRAG